MRKFIFWSLLIAGIAGTIGTASAAAFSDISGHWAEKDIDRAVEQGFVSGYPDDTFRPNGTITRAEAASMLSRVTKLVPAEDTGKGFSDLNGHWSQEQVGKLIFLGFIEAKDYPNGFGPNTPITRFELMKWIASGLAKSDESFAQALIDTKDTLLPTPETYGGGIESHQTPYIAVVKGTGIIEGFEDGSFRPANHATRAEVVAILLRYAAVEGTKAEDYLALNELREVGRTGTNLTSLTPYVYGENTEFQNIIGKPVVTRNNAVEIKVHRMIVVDKIGENQIRGVYADMFTDGKLEFVRDWNRSYVVYLETSITPLVDKLDPLAYANATGDGLSTGYSITEANPSYRIPTLSNFNFSDQFEKGVTERLWVSNVIDKTVPEGLPFTHRVIRTKDGSSAYMVLREGESTTNAQSLQ